MNDLEKLVWDMYQRYGAMSDCRLMERISEDIPVKRSEVVDAREILAALNLVELKVGMSARDAVGKRVSVWGLK